MKLMVWVFCGVGIGIPLACAEPFEVLELGLTINGVILPLELPPSREYATALREGAYNACKRPQHATEHYANMLQARCVTANVRAGMDQRDIIRNCLGDTRRKSFVKLAEVICASLRPLLAHEGQSSRSDSCMPVGQCSAIGEPRIPSS